MRFESHGVSCIPYLKLQVYLSTCVDVVAYIVVLVSLEKY